MYFDKHRQPENRTPIRLGKSIFETKEAWHGNTYFARCVCVPATPMHAYYNSWLWHLDGWTNFICIGAGQDFAFEMISLNPSNGNSIHPSHRRQKMCQMLRGSGRPWIPSRFQLPVRSGSMRQSLNVAGNHVFQCEWVNFLRFWDFLTLFGWFQDFEVRLPRKLIEDLNAAASEIGASCCKDMYHVHSQVSYHHLI